MSTVGHLTIPRSILCPCVDVSSNVEVSNVTCTSVKLSWSPYSATDAPTRGYVISYKVRSPAEDAAATGTSKITECVITTYFKIPFLSPFTQYEFTVSPAAAVVGSTKVGSAMARAVVATTRHVGNERANAVKGLTKKNIYTANALQTIAMKLAILFVLSI